MRAITSYLVNLLSAILRLRKPPLKPGLTGQKECLCKGKRVMLRDTMCDISGYELWPCPMCGTWADVDKARRTM